MKRAEQNTDMVLGTLQDGALCESIGKRFQRCYVWRSLQNDLQITTLTGQGAEGLTPEEMVAIGHKGMDQLLETFAPKPE